MKDGNSPTSGPSLVGHELEDRAQNSFGRRETADIGRLDHVPADWACCPHGCGPQGQVRWVPVEDDGVTCVNCGADVTAVEPADVEGGGTA